MLIEDMFIEDFYFVSDTGWYYLKRDSFIVFLKSTKEWIAGFLRGFYLVIDFLSPISYIIFTPADMPFDIYIVSIIDCALSLNIGCYLESFLSLRVSLLWFVSTVVDSIGEIVCSMVFLVVPNLFFSDINFYGCDIPAPCPNSFPS